MSLLSAYQKIVGPQVISQLRQLAAPLAGARVVHVNSTRTGGGVAEILAKLIPLTRELGIDTKWEVVGGESDFYDCTKRIHNALQGQRSAPDSRLLADFEKTNARNAAVLRDSLEDSDFVFIHDPQPAPLLSHFPKRKGKWIWRCHIDASHPYRPVWNYLKDFVAPYDASIFSLAAFAQELPHPQYLVPPSIDPLSDKNIELPEDEIQAVLDQYGINPQRPLVAQISRYDWFKDPTGVVQAYRIAKKFVPSIQLLLAGGSASDDPEGEAVLAEVSEASQDDPDVHVLLLPADAHRQINALQRAADVVLQKSIKEGFGLTVTEAMWKGKPVIGGDTGGIRLQVVNHHTGFLVSTPEGAALRIRYLLHHPDKTNEMGEKAREFVRDNFLLTRHLREYMTLMVALLHGLEDRIELNYRIKNAL